ncbi:MAG: alanine--tRNA ligase, partial [Gorillibacterium sp.]|nr:alanine--tRNA ligase [Gorillibacterium sp.]
LYDTFGFPFDLTEDFASEHGLTVDREGFDKAMNEQRERARGARQETESMKIQGGPLSQYKDKSLFVGYNEWITQANVIAIVHNNQMVELVSEGEECSVILSVTPFYAESGGQVSDRGFIENSSVKAMVTDVAKAPHGQHVIALRIERGTLKLGDKVVATIDRTSRQEIVKNHTATHLLHKALKEVLGDHVNQAGSHVMAERLRFDFSHFGTITAEEIKDIENRVNRQIWLNTELLIAEKSIDEAKAMGATALFGEKYGDIVRVVRVGDYSMELCGGCHVGSTAEIGLLKIVSETGIGSGVRRMEAVTGRHAYEYVEQQLQLLEQSAALLKTHVQDVPKRIEGLLGQLRESNRENDSLKSKLMNAEAGSLNDQIKEIGGIQVLSALVDAPDMDALRSVLDQLKGKISSGVIVLGAGSGDKVNLIAMVTPDLIARGYHAGKIVKAAAAVCGGGGGGRADMAQAGGKDASKLAEALLAAEAVIAETSLT